MKTRYFFILLLGVLPIAVTAKPTGAHCFALWGEGGVANYVGKTSGSKAAIGGGGAVGLGYEYRGGQFLLQTGLGARYTNTGLKINDGNYDVLNQFDSENWEIEKFQYRERNRKDSYNQLALQVPILAGAHFDAFYFLVGAKVGVNLYNQTKAEGLYRTLGYYEQFIDPFENMDNHKFFTEGTIKTTSTNPLSINVAASAEIGAEFNLPTQRGGANRYLRVAAFLDFNILDDTKKSNNALITFPATYAGITKLQDIKQVDYLHSSAANPLRQLFAGVKVTFLISSKVRYNCVICEGGYPSDRDRRRGSRLFVN